MREVSSLKFQVPSLEQKSGWPGKRTRQMSARSHPPSRPVQASPKPRSGSRRGEARPCSPFCYASDTRRVLGRARGRAGTLVVVRRGVVALGSFDFGSSNGRLGSSGDAAFSGRFLVSAGFLSPTAFAVWSGFTISTTGLRATTGLTSAALPILTAPSKIAPDSTTKLAASTSPNKRPVDLSRTVPEQLRLATNSPPISAPPIRSGSSQRKWFPAGMTSRPALKEPLMLAVEWISRVFSVASGP